MNRREVLKLGLLLSIHDSIKGKSIALPKYTIQHQKHSTNDLDYSIRNSSLATAKLLFNSVGLPPKELRLHFDLDSEMSGYDDLMVRQVNRIDENIRSIIFHELIEGDGSLPTNDDRAFNERTLPNSEIYLVDRSPSAVAILPVANTIAKFVAQSLASGIIYDVTNDWVSKPNNEAIQSDNLEQSLKSINSQLSNLRDNLLLVYNKTDEELDALAARLSVDKEALIEAMQEGTNSIEELLNKKFVNNDALINSAKESIEEVSHQMADYESALSNLSIQVDENGRLTTTSKSEIIEIVGGKIDTVGKYVFLGLPPHLQLRALQDQDLDFVKKLQEEGRYDNVLNEVNRSVEQVDFDEWYSNLQNNINSATALIGQTYQASLALGLKGKDAERASEIVDIAGQAASIALAFASSNPVGYASGIVQSIGLAANVFGGGGDREDPTAKMLQQISAQLVAIQKGIKAGFEHLDKKLDNLADLQVQLYSNIAESIEHQTRFQQQWFEYIAASLEDLEEKLDLVLRKEDDILVFIRNLSQREIGIINDYELVRIEEYGNQFDTFEDYRRAYDQPQFGAGLQALNEIVVNIRNNNELSYFSILETGISKDASLTYKKIKYMYEPCLRLFNSFYPSDDTYRKAMFGLLNPTKTNHDSYKALLLDDDIDNFQADYEKLTKLNETFLSPFAIAKIASLYLTYYPYYEIYEDSETFVPGNAAFYSSLSVDIKTDRITTIRRNFDSLIDIVNQSIAQQAVLSGHLLLHKLDFVLEHGALPELYEDAQNALKSNYLLSTNYLMRQLYYKLYANTENRGTLAKYNTAYQSSDLKSLSALTGYNVQLLDDNRLYVHLFDNHFFLPTADEVEKNDMIYSSEFNMLFDVRSSLTQEKVKLKFGNLVT